GYFAVSTKMPLIGDSPMPVLSQIPLKTHYFLRPGGFEGGNSHGHLVMIFISDNARQGSTCPHRTDDHIPCGQLGHDLIDHIPDASERVRMTPSFRDNQLPWKLVLAFQGSGLGDLFGIIPGRKWNDGRPPFAHILHGRTLEIFPVRTYKSRQWHIVFLTKPGESVDMI